jgi:hypothetical protein
MLRIILTKQMWSKSANQQLQQAGAPLMNCVLGGIKDMKAISIKQPWASMIIDGMKPVENRSRPWKHKGPVMIHASKSFDEEGLQHIKDECHSVWAFRHTLFDESRNLTGGFIGSVNMAGCVTEHRSPWFFGPYGYVFKNPKSCDLIPWKGKQGVMNVPFCPHCFQNIEDHGPCGCTQ